MTQLFKMVDGERVPLSDEDLAQIAIDEAVHASSWRQPLIADLRARRDQAMNVFDGIQSDALADGDMPAALACKVAKATLRDLPSQSAYTQASDEEAFRRAAREQWAAIAGGFATRPDLVARFNAVLK